MAETEDHWLSVDEICKCPRVSSATVYCWVDRFGMPVYHMGLLRKFKKDQVDVWAEAGGASADSSKEDVGKDLKQ